MAEINSGPANLPVSFLLQCNCGDDCQCGDYRKYRHLMDPAAFNKNKHLYLDKRPIENARGGEAIYKMRCQSATYSGHVKSLIRYVVGSCFQSAPAIVPINADPYWASLNSDFDGAGHSLTEQLIDYLTEGVSMGRAYLSVSFPDSDDITAADLAQQKGAGILDARACIIPAEQIKQSKRDEYGNLIYVLRHVQDDITADIFSPRSGIRHTFTYFTPYFVQDYVSIQTVDKDDVPDPKWESDGVANSEELRPHNLGAVPLVELAPLHILKELANDAIGIFRVEAAHDWLLRTSAYSQMFIASTNASKENANIVSSELHAIVCEQGAQMSFPSPNASHFIALQQRTKDKILDMYLALQSLAAKTPALPSGPRQSGSAKEIDYTGLQTLVSQLAASVRDSLRNWVALVKRARNEDGQEIIIQGLDRFDVTGIGSKLDLAERLLPLPIGVSAKRYIIGDLVGTATASAPAEMKVIIQQEIAALTEEELDIAPIAPQAPPLNADPQMGQNDGQIENNATGVEGMQDSNPVE